jgi:cysteine-rich repeat protein
MLAGCGDGVVETGVEQCDDGNTDNTDACVAGCLNATCGDGFVEAGVEECDDANGDFTDSCVAFCISATCGDGFVEAGVEQCDDGNQVDTDACHNDCTTNMAAAVCGNNKIEAGEQCDDGNTISGDGCSATCQTETVEHSGGGCSACAVGTRTSRGAATGALLLMIGFAVILKRRRSS